MPPETEVIACPACRHLVRVPADWLGQPVQCPQCQSDFAIGARYCHVCGADRNPAPAGRKFDWVAFFRRYANWKLVTTWLGLNTASSIAFILGAVCAVAALITGLIYNAQTTLEWQAIQLWRVEWLLGSVAAFLAGILLRRHASD